MNEDFGSDGSLIGHPKKVKIQQGNEIDNTEADLALHESTDPAFRVTHNFDIIDFYISREMVGEQMGKLLFIDTRGKAEKNN